MPLTAPPCTPAQIAIIADGGDGAFDGMSHSGTYLNMRNTGARACRLPGLPPVRLLDRRGRALPAVRRAPAGMHPGPVVMPVTIEAGACAQLSLRWVSGPVFDRSRCLTPARVAVTIGTGASSVRLTARVCGPAGAPAAFEQTVLKPIADYPAE